MGLTSRVRIIVISQFFGPDQSAVGQFLADFANGASDAGHDVRVICGANDYAAEEVAARGSAQRENSESSAELPRRRGSIHVARVRTATFSQSKPKKLISYATFYAGAVWRALRIPRPDVVVTLTAPPGLAWIGWIVQQIRGCRHIAWEMDLYPDIAIALNIPVARWTSMMLDFPRRRADSVIAPGDCMKIATVAAQDSRGSNCRRGELGRWADDFSLAVSHATAASHSLLRKLRVGPRC